MQNEITTRNICRSVMDRMVCYKQIERIAEEIDKVCTIANWEDAVAKYKV